ncbi:MAG: four helix bundle protein [Bacteroidales bacterium]
MAENILKNKTYDFALRVIEVYKGLKNEQKEFVLSKQLLKSGTSIGAMVREAEFAQSKADFISKLSIALKEANETNYWISILKDSSYFIEDTAVKLLSQNEEIIKLLIASINTSKRSLQKSK